MGSIRRVRDGGPHPAELAARAMGYRIRVLDPDPGCPAAAIADHVEVGSNHDVAAALRMAQGCSVVTYELERIDAAIVEAPPAAPPGAPRADPAPRHPGSPCRTTIRGANGVPVAAWREVVTGDTAGMVRAATDRGLPLRVKAAFGGFDGRSQVRITTDDEVHDASARLGIQPGIPVLVEAELDFRSELSVVCARSVAGTTQPFPPDSNRHSGGILAESLLPADISDAIPSPGPGRMARGRRWMWTNHVD